MARGVDRSFKIFSSCFYRCAKVIQIAVRYFTTEFLPPDEDVLLLLHEGYEVAQIAKALYSDINLVALKVAELNRQGHCFRGSDYNTRFLK